MILASTSVLHEYVASAFAEEALACEEAARLGLELGTQKVFLEGDSLSVIKKCGNLLMDRSSISPYINNIKNYSRFF